MRNQILLVITLINLVTSIADKNIQEQKDYTQSAEEYINQVLQKKKDSFGYHNFEYQKSLGFQLNQSGHAQQDAQNIEQGQSNQEKRLKYPFGKVSTSYSYGTQHSNQVPFKQQSYNHHNIIQENTQGTENHNVQNVPQSGPTNINLNNLLSLKGNGDSQQFRHQTIRYYPSEEQQNYQIRAPFEDNQQYYHGTKEGQNQNENGKEQELQNVRYVTYIEQPTYVNNKAPEKVPAEIPKYKYITQEAQTIQPFNQYQGYTKQNQQVSQSGVKYNSANELYKNKQIVELLQPPRTQRPTIEQSYQSNKQQVNNVAHNKHNNKNYVGQYTNSAPQVNNGVKEPQNKYISYVINSAQKFFQGSKLVVPFVDNSGQSNANNAFQGNAKHGDPKQQTQFNYLSKPLTVPYPQTYPVRTGNRVPLTVPQVQEEEEPESRPLKFNLPSNFPSNNRNKLHYPANVVLTVPYGKNTPVNVPHQQQQHQHHHQQQQPLYQQQQPHPQQYEQQVPVPVYVVVEKQVPVYVTKESQQQYQQQTEVDNDNHKSNYRAIQKYPQQYENSASASQNNFNNNAYNNVRF